MTSETVESLNHEEEETDDDSVDVAVQSPSPSVASPDAAASRQAARGLPQTKTSFFLAHPPPSSINRQRLGIRPRLLLQLQRLSNTARPAPAFDVVPSTILPSLTRSLPRFFGIDGVGPDDLVIMSSEHDNVPTAAAGYSGNSSGNGRDSDSRRVVANITQRRKEDGAEIHISDGPLWHAALLPSGSYEFVTMDSHGVATTVRWIYRPLSPRRSGTLPKTQNRAAVADDKKFNFSIIKSGSRRHPVIATMTRTQIDVDDAYPSSVPPATPRSPAVGQASSASYFDAAPESNIIQTDERLRSLILVTGIWVAWCEGWVKNNRPADPAASSADVRGAAIAQPSSSHRSVSTPLQKRATSNPLESRHTPTSGFSSGDPSSSPRGVLVNRSRIQGAPSTPTAAGDGQARRRRAKSVGFDLPGPGPGENSAGQASHNGSASTTPRARQESSGAQSLASHALDGGVDRSQSRPASETTESPGQVTGHIIEFPDARRRRRWSRIKSFFRNLRPGSRRL